MSANLSIENELAKFYDKIRELPENEQPSINPDLFYSRGDPRVTLSAIVIWRVACQADSDDDLFELEEKLARRALQLCEAQVIQASGKRRNDGPVERIDWTDCADADFDLIESHIWHEIDLKNGVTPRWDRVSFSVDELQMKQHQLPGLLSPTMTPEASKVSGHQPFPKMRVMEALEVFFKDPVNQESRPGADKARKAVQEELGISISREPFRELFKQMQPTGWSIGGRRKSRRN